MTGEYDWREIDTGSNRRIFGKPPAEKPGEKLSGHIQAQPGRALRMAAGG